MKRNLKNQSIEIALVAVSLVLLVSTSSVASSFTRLSVEDLATASTHVVRGQFVELESRWSDDGSMIYTRAVVEVSETYAGAVAGDRIVVLLPGGTVGDLSMLVVGGPEATLGSDTVLMLNASPETDRGMEAFGVNGLSQGVFDVTADPTSGEEYVISQALGHRELLRSSSEALRSDDQTLTLTQLVDRVRTATGQ